MLGINVWFQWLLLAAGVGLSVIFQRSFAIIPYQRLATFSLGLAALALWWFLQSDYRLRLYRLPAASLIAALSGVWLIQGMAVNEITPYVVTDAYFVLGALLVTLIARSMWMIYVRSGKIGPQDCRLPNSLFIVIAIVISTGKWTGVSLGPEFPFLLLSNLGVLSILRQARPWHFITGLGSCVFFAINGNRGFLLASLAAMALIVTCALVRIRLAKKGMVALLMIAAPIGFFFLLDFADSREADSALARRLDEINTAATVISGGGTVEDIPIAMYQRVYEAEQVADSLTGSNNPLIPIFGYGFGALISMEGSSDESVTSSAQLGASRVHNIHFLPFMIGYRFGLVGLLLLSYFLIKVGKTILDYLSSRTDLMPEPYRSVSAYRFGCLIFVVSSIIYSLPASATIFNSTLLFVAIGILSYSGMSASGGGHRMAPLRDDTRNFQPSRHRMHEIRPAQQESHREPS